jgi:hypothetical protein
MRGCPVAINDLRSTTDLRHPQRARTARPHGLARALNRLHARLRTDRGPVDVHIDADFLKVMPFMLNLVTDDGDVDLTFRPAGPLDEYRGLALRAIEVEIAPDLKVHIAALDDIIDSKRAAGRVKDLNALPYLESLRDEIATRHHEKPD